MNRLTGKVCVVTGGASGIGRETALAYLREGATVHVLDRDEQGLALLARQYRELRAVEIDITDNEAVSRFHSGLERLDVQFNCAGMVAVGDLKACTPEDWQRSLDLNVTSVYLMMRAAVELMLRQRSGSIINVASVISSIGAAPDRFAYGTTKAAVIGMTKSVALDYAPANIRCNAICPSAVETPSMTARIEAMLDSVAARRSFDARQPLGRMGPPAEIAELAVYLASDLSGFMTGSALVIDGGAKL